MNMLTNLSCESKSAVRKLVRALREKQPEAEYYLDSEFILQHVAHSEAFMKARIILAYWSIKGEVFTHDFVRHWSHHKTILLPVVEGDQMAVRKYNEARGLQPGEGFGIPEPVGENYTTLDSIDFVIVPGIAFDTRCNRMGRGKAYYDRFLPRLKALKAGICFKYQYFDTIPTDTFDIQMDFVFHS